MIVQSEADVFGGSLEVGLSMRGGGAKVLYKIGPGNVGTHDARIELVRIDETSTAVVLQSQGGPTGGRPSRNTGYAPALRQILLRLLSYQGTITRVLIDSEKTRRRYTADERVLFVGSDLGELTAEEAVTAIRRALRRFDQAPGVKGGNSTKQVRIETNRSLLSIRSSLQLTRWDGGEDGLENFPRETQKSDSEPALSAEIEEALDTLPAEPEDRRYAEGDLRIVDHFRRERRRNSAAVRDKRAAVRAANSGLLACENPDCSVDWYERYTPKVAEAIFDIHHTVPLAEMATDHETRIEDLICLCANCHRAEHRRMLHTE
jgi:hypothetical protein